MGSRPSASRASDAIEPIIMVVSWGVAGDVVVIEWGEKSCEMEFEMNLENNFKLLSHHYSSCRLPSIPPPQNDDKKQRQHQDNGQQMVSGKKGPKRHQCRHLLGHR